MKDLIRAMLMHGDRIDRIVGVCMWITVFLMIICACVIYRMYKTGP